MREVHLTTCKDAPYIRLSTNNSELKNAQSFHEFIPDTCLCQPGSHLHIYAGACNLHIHRKFWAEAQWTSYNCILGIWDQKRELWGHFTLYLDTTSTLAEVCNHHPIQFLKNFSTAKRSRMSICVTPHFPPTPCLSLSND